MSPERDIVINEAGRLVLGGCDAVQLAKTYGTPLYVVDEGVFRERARRWREALRRHADQGRVLYAGKALLTAAIVRIVEEEQLGLDVVSGGELYTALAAGFPPERIYFHGNNKSEAELQDALAADVGHIVVDGEEELLFLASLARARGVTARVLLRITPGIEAQTHTYVQTGQIDSKFGFPLKDGLALQGARLAASLEGLELVGYHSHIGSQILDTGAFEAAAERLLDFVAEAREITGVEPRQLNVGGGLGIRYTGGDKEPDIESFVEKVAKRVVAGCRARGLAKPMLLFEPGRSIAGPAGTTLYSVGFQKTIPGVRTYVAVDGGMGDNPRVALYDARHEAVLANKAAERPTEVVSVAGKYCETGDMLLYDVPLPKPERGDVLAVFDTGAYNYSMASNYNRLPRPAVVLVGNGRHDVIVRRETYADVTVRDVLPERLRREDETC